MPASPASAIAPKVSPNSNTNKDPSSVTNFLTSKAVFNYDLDKRLIVSNHDHVVCVSPKSISPPPAFLLNLMALPFYP